MDRPRSFLAVLVAAALACFAALAALVFWSMTASAEAPSPAETRVRAFTPTTAVIVGVHECISAGQRPVRGPSQLQVVSGHCVAAEAVPARLARVTEARFAGSPSLGPPGAGRVFVTAADDIQGITPSQGLAQRLTLLDDAGKLRQGPFSVSAFDTPAEGLGVPVFRSNPGFVQGGFTGGGAREFDLPNRLYGDLGNVEQWIVR